MPIDITTEVRGLRETLIELKQAQPTLYKELVSDMNRLTGPLQAGVMQRIPSDLRMKGFRHNGRTAWNKGAIKSQAKVSTRKPRGNAPTALVKLVFSSASLEIADMAGHRNARPRKNAQSRKYMRNGREMRHRLNGQGQAMISRLNSIGKASRFVWPAIEREEGRIREAILQSMEQASETVNRNLLVVNK